MAGSCSSFVPFQDAARARKRDIPGEIAYMSDRARQWAESLPGENFEASLHHRGRLKKRDLQAVHFLLSFYQATECRTPYESVLRDQIGPSDHRTQCLGV